jgi:hypothetical protein
MFEWGQRHLPPSAPLRMIHAGCGAEARVSIRCTEGHDVPPEELAIRLAKGGR